MSARQVRNPPITKPLKFTIDASVLIEDSLFNAVTLADYLRTHIKINGRESAKGEQVLIRPADAKVVVTSTVGVSKRYFKYLVKRFLKSNHLLNYVRVLSTDKGTYKLKYINIAAKNEKE